MSEPTQLVRDFLAALADHRASLEPYVHEDATLRLWGWSEGTVARPRDRVIAVLRDETVTWPAPSLEIFTVLGGGAESRIAADFRIVTQAGGEFVEHNRSLFATLKEGRLHQIDVYAARPQPSARRQGYHAPADVSREEVLALLREGQFTWDPRENVTTGSVFHNTPFAGWGGMDIAHPGGNFMGRAVWTPEEADARIDETIAHFSGRGVGFQWWVGPFDKPADLCERLERHGLMRAGEVAKMARVGLADLSDIPVNDQVTVEVLDGSSTEAIEESFQIIAQCFHFSPEQTEAERPSWHENVLDPVKRERGMLCLARLNGRAVATGRVGLRGATCYLGGAATLPEARGQRIYSTLLKGRLAAAHVQGFNIAVIDAGPMSRRVVAKYGFEVYGLTQIYGWMPEMDPEAIKTLVPDD